MPEELVTKAILKFLKENSWEILTFDFPQSGTGINIRSTNNDDKSINFDIIAKKGNQLIFFENKSYKYLQDFVKLNNFLKNIANYTPSIEKIFRIDLSLYEVKTAIGLPKVAALKIKEKDINLVDILHSRKFVTKSGKTLT